MKLKLQLCLTIGLLLYELSAPNCVSSQIVPDTSLPNSSRISVQDNIDTIEGGTQKGSNLFHSFTDLSVPTGSTAYFNNTKDIQNIFTRVTGSSLSNIDGLIKANHTANLFLLNPNGIIFGPNARLDLGGSFLASTASSINFADGTQFSAKNAQATPLLTVNVPIGLQFTGNPGTITVQGTGHRQFIVGNQVAASITLIGSGESQNGLRLQPNKTLALVGGDVLFEGGVVTTPNGRIEISSVDSGKINLISIPFGWSFGNEGTNSFKDIKLTKQSLLDASGASFGDIHIQGRNINFTDGSLALIANSNSLNPGAIRLDAAETIGLTGITFYNNQPFLRRQRLNRGIITSAESGKGADIIISTKNLIARDSTLVASLAFGNSLGGNLIIKSAELVKILGVAANESSGVGSSFSTINYGSNQAGNIGLSTKQLWIEDGGTLESLTFGSGEGGNVNVNTSEFIKVLGGYAVDVLLAFGTKPISSFSPSRILAQSISSGNAGNINIQTKHLMIENGGRIAASGLKTGNSGNIFVNASDSINVSGSGLVNPLLNPSTISSSVNTVDPFLRYLYNIQQPPEAFSGDITIKTGSLNLKDGAQVAVRNDSKKDAGIVRVEADFVNLDRQSDITAATASGKGGDIFLRSQTLQLSNGSSITTDASGGTGNGGNIVIDTNLLTILEKSNITANAVRGQGGK
jgi:filamentous hemagglutinin family protein